jgi:hypothetical protein
VSRLHVACTLIINSSPLVVSHSCEGLWQTVEACRPLAHRWNEPCLATLCPLVASFVAQQRLVGQLDVLEQLVTAGSLRSLAWRITAHVATWFPWAHPLESEARLVLLSQGGMMVIFTLHYIYLTQYGCEGENKGWR